jgi:acetoin utilization protein AcuB
MLIKKWMSKNVTTVQANDSVIKAQILLKDHSISRLPVMEKGRLIGIVTGWDLKRVFPSETLKVKNVMTRDPITVPLDFTFEEVAEVLLDNKISGVPVIGHDGEIEGIITRTDVLGALIKVTGVRKKGFQFALQVKDRPGVVKETVDLVRMHGGRIVSIIISDERVPTGYRRIYIRISGIDRFNLGRLQDVLGKIGDLLYTVDRLDVV